MFLNKIQRAQLTEEFIECLYEVDENYDEIQEDTDREWLSHLDNVAFCREMADQMPDAVEMIKK